MVVWVELFEGNHRARHLSLIRRARVLVKDVDYTVTYSRNKCPGKAAVTITGTGCMAGGCNPIVQHGLGQAYGAAWAVMRAVHGLCPSFRTFGL